MGVVAGVKLADTEVDQVTRLYNGRGVGYGVRVTNRSTGALYEEWLGFQSLADAEVFQKAEAGKLMAGLFQLQLVYYAPHLVGDGVLS